MKGDTGDDVCTGGRCYLHPYGESGVCERASTPAIYELRAMNVGISSSWPVGWVKRRSRVVHVLSELVTIAS